MLRNEYVIESEKVDSDKNIAVCSDMHINRKTSIKKIDDVLNTIEEIKPTHIVIPGDLYDVEQESISNIKTSTFIKGLTSIAPVFYVKGNIEQKSCTIPHEFYNNRNHNLHLLCENIYGECDIIRKDINVAGIKLPISYYSLNEQERVEYILKEYERYLEKLSKLSKKNEFSVLLCHDPIIVEALKQIYANFDLIISGHNHGGIWPTWMKPVFKLTKTNMSLCYPTYVKGMIDSNNQELVISEGVTRYNSDFGVLQLLEKKHVGTIENIKILKK